ncbi:hypothetical protein TPY_0504 [Sulfobacillus acidophilus TPY]|nr:hypothetical protein TPY_0504 [Sulfobacillus acidophilus TPY]
MRCDRPRGHQLINAFSGIPSGVTFPRERLLALIINILTARQPLYRGHEPLALTDTPLL